MARRTDSSKKRKSPAVKRRKVEPEILTAAIKLFGLHGFRGVTTRDVAQEANVVEGSIYAWFKSKDLLYLKAVTAVVDDLNQEFGRFALTVFGGSEDVDLGRISEALRAWFVSLPQVRARLLMQVLMAGDNLNQTARKPLEQLINIIAKALTAQTRANPNLDPQAAARFLIRALFHTRVVESESVAEEDTTQIIRFFTSVMPSSSK
jgi:AcrR family transcriptional regulator